MSDVPYEGRHRAVSGEEEMVVIELDEATRFTGGSVDDAVQVYIETGDGEFLLRLAPEAAEALLAAITEGINERDARDEERNDAPAG